MAIIIIVVLGKYQSNPTVDFTAPTLERCNEVRTQDISAGHNSCSECMLDQEMLTQASFEQFNYKCYN